MARKLNAALLAAAILAPCLLLAPHAAAKPKYAVGEAVEFKGVVTDGAGQPLDDVRVVLDLTSRKFRVRYMRKVVEARYRYGTRTDERGQYTLRWPWDGTYNEFELLVGIPVRDAEGERLHVLSRAEVTEKVEAGSPVVTPLVVRDATFLYTFRGFLEGLDSADEKRVYAESGRPDKVETHGSEERWWYFAQGKSYLFLGGELEKTETFKPVKEF